MKIENQTHEGPDAQKYNDLLTTLNITNQELERTIKELLSKDNPTNVTVRLLNPGRSGAGVLVASFLDKNRKQNDWVVKLFHSSKNEAYEKELQATQKHAGSIHQQIEIRECPPRAFAIYFAKVSHSFSTWVEDSRTTKDVELIVEKLFNKLLGWYSAPEISLHHFFEDFSLNEVVRNGISELGFNDILTKWNDVSKLWPITRGYLKVTTHGDLNPTNILLTKSSEFLDVYLIDFANTSKSHWAYDFVRLERQLKFIEGSDHSEKISQKADMSFDIERDEHDTTYGNILGAIKEIRNQAKNIFFSSHTQYFGSTSNPSFESEYFMMLAFQQLYLTCSNAWNLNSDQKLNVCLSTKRILSTLLRKPPEEYLFGYFCFEDDGREQVLLEVDDEKSYKFPISRFQPLSQSVNETINESILEILDSDPSHKDFIEAGFSKPEVLEINPPAKREFHILRSGIDIHIKPIFVKIKLAHKMDFNNQKYTWFDKREFLQNEIHAVVNPEPEDRFEHLDPETSVLAEALCQDRIERLYNKRVLECVDIIVFRENGDQFEFLMLDRQKPGERNSGWEYPKGGLEYHETVREGAIRELLEETGIQATGGFRYGGYLGCQTTDISYRKKKEYDTLRVHGVTYLFYGRDEDINLKDSQEGHVAKKWMKFSEAQNNIWIGKYGKRFFSKWKDKEWEIRRRIARPISLAFQVTEECPLGCSFCLRRTGQEKDQSLEERKEIVDILAERGILRLTVTGGEPVLKSKKDDVFELLEYAHEKRIHTCLSTTGFNLEEYDFKRLDSFLDQILLSAHSIDPSLKDQLYDNPKVWNELNSKLREILEWTTSLSMIVEISSVVSKVNLNHALDLGEFLFGKNPKIFWRLDEYYPNGNQDSKKANFELAKGEFEQIQESLINSFPRFHENGQLRFSTRDSREVAPDIMITPQGNLVTSSGCGYKFKGSKHDLLFFELKNRRPWGEYRNCIRTDWNW